MKRIRITSLLLIVLFVSVFTSCAAAGNMIPQTTLLGVLDLAVAAGITLFIFKGSSK